MRLARAVLPLLLGALASCMAPCRVPESLHLRVATYNVHRCEGTDGVLDLERVARVIEGLDADVVGLQEVDVGTTRSAGVDQARALGERLGMHHVHGAFMPFQGGLYGMAVLSRLPIVAARAFELPEGNEPRVALLVDVRLPDGSELLVANVHFDWVDDDGFRFAQAEALAAELATVDRPYLLVGDFNDRPGTRTIELFRTTHAEARKPDGDRLTWSSTAPEMEIDYLLAWPPQRWDAGAARVVDEPLASDHRPVVAEFVLR